MYLIQNKLTGINYQVHTQKEALALGLDWETAQPLIEGISQIPEYLALDAKTADDLTREEAEKLIKELRDLIGDHPEVVRVGAFLSFLCGREPEPLYTCDQCACVVDLFEHLEQLRKYRDGWVESRRQLLEDIKTVNYEERQKQLCDEIRNSNPDLTSEAVAATAARTYGVNLRKSDDIRRAEELQTYFVDQMNEIIALFEAGDVASGGAMLMRYFCDYLKDDDGPEGRNNLFVTMGFVS